ncbi:MAG: Wzz/FepE/Etk N-terminal domain-containing protein [Desulfobulbaceae bacterium]|nr:Wzz/FepE/Etk N-terminal domain-containing protein [Desulfobulbaceae bacterium]
MDQEQRQLIKKYLDILMRRKKMIIAFFLLGVVAGLGLYLKTPKVYQCISLIKYERQQVNPNAMSPDDVRSRTQEVVSTVSQQITSRSSLEALIKEFDLYAEMRASLPMEDVVDMMREKHIEISQERGDIFKVSYQGGDPKKVLRVTNAIAAKFIEENLRYREERASETSVYIRDELRMAKEGLDKNEAVMRDYKLKYYNEMPAQLANNMTRLSALQEQYQNNQVSAQDLERTKVMVQEQISLRGELLAQQLNSGAGAAPVMPGKQQPTGIFAQIAQLRAELQNLQARYTDKHPEVRRVKKQLQELEAEQKAAMQQTGEAAAAAGGAKEAQNEPYIDPQIEQLKQQLSNLEYNIERLKQERGEIKKEIEQYQKWVESTPIREAEWAALTRDYEQLHQRYQELVGQSLLAESAQSLEKHQKGSQFKIVDPAHFPEKPFKPDFKKIMLIAVGLGLGIGGGLALGLELVGTSFKDPADVEKYLGIPIVCAVPNIYTEAELKKRKIRQIFWGALLFVCVILIVAATGYFWKQGMIIL